MKKMLFCAVAAIVALASCSKTHVVYNDAPQEIAFKQISGVMTKAETSSLIGTMGVFAYTVTSPNVYFGNTSFSQSGEVWVANPSLYYPIQGQLDFAYYAPYAENWTWNGSTTMTSPKMSDIKNIDVLYGKSIKRSAKKQEALDVTLAHALAQITVNVQSDANSKDLITINSVIISQTKIGGKLTVAYTASNTDESEPYVVSGASWDQETSTDVTLTNNSFTLSETSAEYGKSFIIAEYGTSGTSYEQGTITVNYTMSKDKNSQDTYTGSATFDLSPDSGTQVYWYMGKNYIYNITATLTEIKFNSLVENLELTPAGGTAVTL